MENQLESNQRKMEDKDLLKSMWSAIMAYLPLFVLSVFGFGVMGFLIVRYKSPTYEVSAKILVKDEKKTGIGGSAGSLLSELDLFGAKKIVENELEILKSRPIIETAVRQLNSNLKVFKDGRIRDVIMNYHFPLRFEPLNTDSVADVKEKFRFKLESDAIVFSFGTFPLKDSTLIQFPGVVSPVILRLNKSEVDALPSRDYFLKIGSVRAEVRSILENLELSTTGKNTSIIDIRLNTKDVTMGETMVDLIIDSYNKAAVFDKRQIAQFTLDFIEGRLALVTGQLDSVEKNIEVFKESNRIVDLSEQGKIFLESVKHQDEELNKIEVQISVLKEIDNYLDGKGTNPGTVPSLMGIDDPVLARLLPNLYELEFNYSKRQRTVGSKDEELLSMEGEIVRLKGSIKESVHNIRRNLEVAKRKINDELSGKMSILSSLPGQERLLLDISRQQAIKNAIYTFLLEKREESAISFASTVSDVRVIEPAQGDLIPKSPNKSLLFGVLMLFALLVPGMFIYFKEVLNGKVLFRKDIEQRTSISVLGEVLQGDKSSEFIISSDNRSPVAESVRSVRSKLAYYLQGEQSHVILMSSCLPGEGKSFITTNLGLSFALMEKKTIVIAADLRKPRLHQAFDIQAGEGLSQYLIGRSSKTDIIHPTKFQHLDIIPPGPIPPNPAELLLNGKFKDLIAELRTTYDYVLIDTPPLGLISDAEIMADYVDLSLFVVRHDHSLKDAVHKILGPINHQSKFWPAAVVFNGLKHRGIGRGKKGYGYGGAYGTGYGSSYGHGYE